MLRFDKSSGAMICDEESAYLERRRTHFDENIRNLLEPEISKKFDIEAAYGGAGYPPFHYEVVRKARKAINRLAKDRDSLTLEDVARETLKCLRSVIHRRIDDKLMFYFGFNLDELNQGFFEKDGKKFDIKQDSVKKKARDIASFADKSEPLKNIFENKAAVMGYDKKEGFQAYHISGDVTVLSFLTGFESIGSGKYGAGITFARTFNNKFHCERREGFNPVDGMILLLSSIIEARNYFIDIGGYFSLTYINGNEENPEKKYIDIDPQKVKLASEVVTANLKRLLGMDKTRSLVEKILFKDNPPGEGMLDELEDEFFREAENPAILKYILRGYKIDPGNLRQEEVELVKRGEEE
ncbi:MAG: hypothetical protein K8T10_06845 [Candidatus Eremiobacteraeota bacterium]|nr:hypothetical protein [Candidatus Eremiobacteraeota bacterium]